MEQYKSYRMIDGKGKWVVTDENEKIINRNPSKEELKGLKEEKPKGNGNYNSTNTCYRCKEKGIETKLVPKKARREYNKEGKWTGRWLCNKCWQNFDPDSRTNIRKSLANRRTGNQNPNSNQTKGDNFQELTCIWRSTISTIPVEDLNKKLDNYRSPIDHSRDSELGIPQTKGKLYDHINRQWKFGDLKREWNKKFDVMIFYCASKDGKIIERIYIIPFEKEIKDKRKGITILKNLTYKGCGWYEKYRVTDEETIKQINDIWKRSL